MFSNAIVGVCILVLCCHASDWSLCFEGCCYYRTEDRVTWQDGYDICKAMGGDFPSIHSKEEDDFVIHSVCRVDHRTRCWIGLHDHTNDGKWQFQWTDGSPVNYTNWYVGGNYDDNGYTGKGYSNKYGVDISRFQQGDVWTVHYYLYTAYASCKKCPMGVPAVSPTSKPTESPTISQTESPTDSPMETPIPTVSPTEMPTESPSDSPSVNPTESPSVSQTETPTESPSDIPTFNPTESPTVKPTVTPTGIPIFEQVQSSLDLCLSIISQVNSFGDVYNNPDHRRSTFEGEELDDKDLASRVAAELRVCSNIVEAVGFFRKKYISLFEKKDGGNWDVHGSIVLNVGGTHFTTSLETLRSVRGSRFEKMFSEESATNRSNDGTYFIDRNPNTFAHILNYLREGDLLIESNDRALRSQLFDDVEYFELPQELKLYLTYAAVDGMELWLSELTFLNKELKKVGRKMGGLLYQNTLDGDSAGNFHSRCDGKGATVVIYESVNGNIFGGYTSRSWSNPSSGRYYSSTGSFLFRLRPSMERYDLKIGRENYAVYHRNTYGPTFGGGHEIYITDYCRSIANCYSSSGNTYDVPSSYELTGGSHNFRIKDYVVLLATGL